MSHGVYRHTAIMVTGVNGLVDNISYIRSEATLNWHPSFFEEKSGETHHIITPSKMGQLEDSAEVIFFWKATTFIALLALGNYL